MTVIWIIISLGGVKALPESMMIHCQRASGMSVKFNENTITFIQYIPVNNSIWNLDAITLYNDNADEAILNAYIIFSSTKTWALWALIDHHFINT